MLADAIAEGDLELIPETDPPLYRMTRPTQQANIAMAQEAARSVVHQQITELHAYLNMMAGMLESLADNRPFTEDEFEAPDEDDEEVRDFAHAQMNHGYL